MQYEAIVIGVSAGGLQALKTFLPQLPATFPIPLIIVQHIGERNDNFMVEYLNRACELKVKEAEDKEPVSKGMIYLAPGGYHLLVEPERVLSLSVDERVNHSCPSIDVLFDSAADAYGKALIGVVLTGANSDGAKGLATITRNNGLAIVQNPESAESEAMPKAALALVKTDYVVDIEQLAPLLIKLTNQTRMAYGTNS